MYTRGLSRLCEENNFSSSTSVDDVKAFILELVNTFCSLTGLVVIPSLTKELTYGIAYYLGKSENDAYPLLCIANPGDSSSYFYRSVYIGGVNSMLYPFVSSTNFSWSNNDQYTYYQIINTQSYAYDIVYLIKDDGTILFGVGQTTASTPYRHFIGAISSGDETCLTSFTVYNGSFYYTYCPEMNVTGSSMPSISALSGADAIKHSIALEKDALFSSYLGNGWKIDNLFKFTNKGSFAKDAILLIGGKRYVLIHFGGTYYLSLLLLIE